MADKEKILDVRDLRISFRTPDGIVKAVRGIDYELYRGETLAIVGESGSGKSVTSRTLLGISAGNAIVESGEIIYNGQDLLKISEDDFHNIRGEKISMIFQDPLSSLNPIIKIGKQLTEAMVIKGKAKQKKARISFNSRLALIKKYMDRSQNAEKGSAAEKKNAELVEQFDKFEYKHTELEGAYNTAKEAAAEAAEEIDYYMLCINKGAAKNDQTCREIIKLALASQNDYVVKEDAAELVSLCAELEKKHEEAVKSATKTKRADGLSGKGDYIPLGIAGGIGGFVAGLILIGGLVGGLVGIPVGAAAVVGWRMFKDNKASYDVHYDFTPMLAPLARIKEILDKAAARPAPSFFAMAYYLTFSGQPLPVMEVPELNEHLKKHLRENFMNEFLAVTEKAIGFAFNESLELKKKVLAEIDAFRNFVEQSTERSEILKKASELSDKVEAAIYKMALSKDSVAYTFRNGVIEAIKKYYVADKNNKKEVQRFEKEKQKIEELKAKGKTPDFAAKPPSLIDLDAVRDAVYKIIQRLEEKYKADIDAAEKHDVAAETRAMVDYLRTKAAAVVLKVTPQMAKHTALRIMEEVGIPDPRKRFNQYPYEFSGGMRQRIVIAIALTANPDILICDEPTTALDVTIQAQILELINNLKKKHNLSVIFITHDLGVVANMADRIAVMYAGKIVESGTAEEVFYEPAHPYTWALLASMPDLETTEKLEAIPGTPPNPLFPPAGDAFAARNKYAMKIDFEEQPPLFKISGTHYAATWLLHPDAPRVEVPKIVTERIERNKKLMAKLTDETAEETKQEAAAPAPEEEPVAKKKGGKTKK